MEPIARGAWTEQQILDALRGRSGRRYIRFRGDVLRGGAKVREVTLGSGSEVVLDRDNDILRTGKFELREALEWLTDELQPIMMLRMEDAISVSSILFSTCADQDALDLSCDGWDARGYTCAQLDAGRVDTQIRAPQYAEFSLGVFLLSTPRRTSSARVTTWEVEGYDRTEILKEDCLDDPLYIPAGTLYLDAVTSLLAGAGITNILIKDYVATAIPAGREIDADTSKLEVINKLLGEINFDPVYCDTSGRMVLSAYRAPVPENIDFAYEDDDMSAISLDTESETDYYATPNVFVGKCSNPDMDVTYRSVYVNDNPLSKFSTVQHGRRIRVSYDFEQIASQADLDAAVKRKAREVELAAGETLKYKTALMPIHGRDDVIGITHPDATGAFDESMWRIPLDPHALMEHTARRVTT